MSNTFKKITYQQAVVAKHTWSFKSGNYKKKETIENKENCSNQENLA